VIHVGIDAPVHNANITHSPARVDDFVRGSHPALHPSRHECLWLSILLPQLVEDFFLYADSHCRKSQSLDYAINHLCLQFSEHDLRTFREWKADRNVLTPQCARFCAMGVCPIKTGVAGQDVVVESSSDALLGAFGDLERSAKGEAERCPGRRDLSRNYRFRHGRGSICGFDFLSRAGDEREQEAAQDEMTVHSLLKTGEKRWKVPEAIGCERQLHLPLRHPPARWPA
jgi:hypothetical protein